MKKLLPILFLGLVLAGCKKSANETETPAETGAKKYDVTFKVADFSTTVSTFSAGDTKKTMAVGDTLKNYADNLYYCIFNSAGNYVKSGSQSSSSPTFGTITDQLLPGTYDVFIAASKGTLSLQAGIQSSYSSSTISASPWNDTFTKNVKITVATSPVTQSVRLERAVGGLEVNLAEEITSNVSWIYISYEKEGSYISMQYGGASSFSNNGQYFPISSADIGVKNKKFFLYIANAQQFALVRIRACDSKYNILAEKIVAPVEVKKNQITQLSGQLLLKSAVDFTVTVNPLWSTRPVQYF